MVVNGVTNKFEPLFDPPILVPPAASVYQLMSLPSVAVAFKLTFPPDVITDGVAVTFVGAA